MSMFPCGVSLLWGAKHVFLLGAAGSASGPRGPLGKPGLKCEQMVQG